MKKIILLLAFGICSALSADVFQVPNQYISQEYKDYFYNELTSAIRQRCVVTDTAIPNAYSWYRGDDAVIVNGAQGWTDKAILKRGINTGIYFRDINGDGIRDNNEPIWSGSQTYNGEPIIAGTGTVNVGEWGKQKGLFYHDADGNGKWNNEGLWIDSSDNFFTDMQAFHTAVSALIPKFVNHTDHGGDWNGQDTIPNWTEAEIMVLTDNGSRVAASQSTVADWIIQQYEILNFLKWIATPYTNTCESKSAFGPAYYVCETLLDAYNDMLAAIMEHPWSTNGAYGFGIVEAGVYGTTPYYFVGIGIGRMYLSLTNSRALELDCDLYYFNTKSSSTYYYEYFPGTSEGTFYKRINFHVAANGTWDIGWDTPECSLFIDPENLIPSTLVEWRYWANIGDMKLIRKYDLTVPTTPPTGAPFTTAEAYLNTIRDTNADGLVDVGEDLLSFGADTGTMNFEPERADAQVFIPLAVNFWDRLPVYAYVVQGGHDYSGYNYWTHPDAEEKGLYQTYSLHTRARINAVIVNASEKTKRIEIIRPGGNTVVFEFDWDTGTSAFKEIGYPTGINAKRTYVLKDVTPTNDTDLQFELHFDSGIIHHFNGGLTKVSHVDGRETTIAAFFPVTGGVQGINIDLFNNTVEALRYDIALQWKDGHISKLEYQTKDTLKTITTNVEYDQTKQKVSKLTKSIPEFSAEIKTASQIEYGTGVTVTKSGNSITTAIPECGSAAVTTSFNTNELVDSVTVTEGSDSAVTTFEYYPETGHYNNGSPKWSKLKKVTYPDHSYEEFEYATGTGWLSKHKKLFKNTLTDITEYSYDNLLSGGDAADTNYLTERPRKAVTTTDSQITDLRFYAYTGSSSIEERKAVDSSADWSTGSNLITTTTFNQYGPPSYATPLGNFTNTSSLNEAKTELTTNTTTPSNSGVSKTNVFGSTFYTSTTEDSKLIAEADSACDSFGRITGTDYLDGTDEAFLAMTPFGPKVIENTENESISVSYYANGKIKTRKTPDAAFAFGYDALGNMTGRTVTPAKGSKVVETWDYDAQGRIKSYSKSAGGDTSSTSYAYSYANGVNTETATHLNKTQITETYIDGRIKSVSGTAATPETFEYGVDGSKGLWEKNINTDSWTQTFYNLNGKPWRTETSAGFWSQVAFDSAGRPQTETDANNNSIVTAYNTQNEVTSRTENGAVTSYDRAYVEKSGKTCLWTRVTKNSTHGNVVTENYASVDGLGSWQVVNTRETHTSTTRHNGSRYTTTVTDPFSRTAEVSNENDKDTTVTKLNGGLITETEVFKGDTVDTSGRTGTSSVISRPLTGQLAVAKAPDGKKLVKTYSSTKDEADNIRLADGSNLQPQVDTRGNLEKLKGDAPGNFDAAKTFDSDSRETDLDTVGAAGTANTERIYDPLHGTLKEKKIQNVSVYNIARHADGRINTLFRQLTDTASVTKTNKYSSSAFKFYEGATYSDGTPEVSVSGHDSFFGLPSAIETANIATYELDYNSDLQITDVDQTMSNGAVDTKDIGYAYSNLKRQTMTVGSDTVTYTQDTATDNLGRIKTIAGLGVSASYNYVGNSMSLINDISITVGSNTYTRDFNWAANADRISEVKTSKGATVYDSFNYTYDSGTGKVTKTALKNGSWAYSYDKLGQLAKASGPSGSYKYDNDSITNVLSGGKIRVNGSAEFTNTPTLFNNISARVVGNTIEITGTAVEEAAVTGYTGSTPTASNTVRAARFDQIHINETTGEPETLKTGFSLSLPANNDTAASKVSLNIVGVKFDSSKTPVTGGGQQGNVAGSDIEVEVAYKMVCPKAEDAPVYDVAGRLVENSLYTYSWDGEDRLIAAESKIPITDDDKYLKVENSYDHAGRRLRKIVKHSTDQTNWTVFKTHKYYYDMVLLDGSPADFGVLAEEAVTDGSDSPIANWKYLWGLDINGSYQGMGGVGGLLAVIDKTNNKTYIPVMDKQGTVHSYIDAAAGEVAQEISYDPYGRVISNTGSVDIPLKFQSKYCDPETGLVYFGFRYYDPSTCKWLSRDPIQEAGGLNLYAYASNDPINNTDYLGCWGWDNDWLETGLDIAGVHSFFTAKGRAAKLSWLKSGLSQAEEMWGGVKVIAQGDANMARKQIVKQAAAQYTNRILMHQATNGGDLNNAINSATGWRMLGSDFVGFTDLDESRTGISYFDASKVEGVQRGQKFFMGTGKFAGTVAFAGGSTMSLMKGYQGTGFAQTWRWATTFEHSGKTYNLIPRTPTPKSPTGELYSVAYEMELNPESYPGISRYMHFKEANIALENAMENIPGLTKLGIEIPKSPTGVVLGKPPVGWVWHHDVNTGVMQLVPKWQHPNIPGGIFWETMHPELQGGYSIWGK